MMGPEISVSASKNYFVFKLHMLQSMLQIQLSASVILGIVQLASLPTKLGTRLGNNYSKRCKIEIAK